MKHLVKYNNDSIPIIFLWNERVGIIKCLQTDVHTHMHIYITLSTPVIKS